MHALVIYDSNYGNTQAIARTIAKEVHADAVEVTDVSEKDLKDIDLLFVGSPINGWQATEKINIFLKGLHEHQLDGTKAATFDTRVKMFFHGDAAGKISNALEHAGATIVATPKGFFVKGTKGPLLDGEAEKAKDWADEIRDTA